MMTNTINKTTENSLIAKRVLYAGFMLTSLYFLINKDITSAVSQLGIGLIFDPFDEKIAWKDRLFYQKLWTLAHVFLFFTCFLIMVFFS